VCVYLVDDGRRPVSFRIHIPSRHAELVTAANKALRIRIHHAFVVFQRQKHFSRLVLIKFHSRQNAKLRRTSKNNARVRLNTPVISVNFWILVN
jgi:hypothetical protein